MNFQATFKASASPVFGFGLSASAEHPLSDAALAAALAEAVTADRELVEAINANDEGRQIEALARNDRAFRTMIDTPAASTAGVRAKAEALWRDLANQREDGLLDGADVVEQLAYSLADDVLRVTASKESPVEPSADAVLLATCERGVEWIGKAHAFEAELAASGEDGWEVDQRLDAIADVWTAGYEAATNIPAATLEGVRAKARLYDVEAGLIKAARNDPDQRLAASIIRDLLAVVPPVAPAPSNDAALLALGERFDALLPVYRTILAAEQASPSAFKHSPSLDFMEEHFSAVIEAIDKTEARTLAGFAVKAKVADFVFGEGVRKKNDVERGCFEDIAVRMIEALAQTARPAAPQPDDGELLLLGAHFDLEAAKQAGMPEETADGRDCVARIASQIDGLRAHTLAGLIVKAKVDVWRHGVSEARLAHPGSEFGLSVARDLIAMA